MDNVIVNFIYVDQDVVITGTKTTTDGNFKGNTVTSCALLKGWNLIAFYSTETLEVEHTTYCTTNIPTRGLKWVYVPFSTVN